MAIQQGMTLTWTKSSHSAGNGACVEVMSAAPDTLSVRDSKVTAGSRLNFPAASWAAFLGGVEHGVAAVGAYGRTAHRRPGLA